MFINSKHKFKKENHKRHQTLLLKEQMSVLTLTPQG